MKVIVRQPQLASALAKAAIVAKDKREEQCLWLEAFRDKFEVGTSGLTLTTLLKLDCEVREVGVVGIRGTHIAAVVSRLSDSDIELSLQDETTLCLKQGRRRYTFPTIPQEYKSDFVKKKPLDQALDSGIGSLLQAMCKVLPATIQDLNMEAWACIHIAAEKDPLTGALDLVQAQGLDGHHYISQSFVNKELALRLPEGGICIAKEHWLKAMRWLGKATPGIVLEEKYLWLVTGFGSLALPRIAYAYPDTAGFVGKARTASNHLLLDLAELKAALARLALFYTEDCGWARFQMDDSWLTLTSGNGMAEETLACKYEGELKEIAMNVRGLSQMLETLSPNNIDVALDFTSKDGPCAITAREDEGQLIVAMPIKPELSEIMDMG